MVLEILHPEDEKIHSALSIYDTIYIYLINLQYGDVIKFVDTEYNAALCRYKYHWDPNIVGKNDT